jgi:hypothetical protein
MKRTMRSRGVALAAGAVASSSLFAAPARAQIKEPGAHPKYAVELEPHFLMQWTNAPWNTDGIGVGVRASIPVIDNGPVTTINNSLAVGFGFDWAHFDDNCGVFYGYRGPEPGYSCTGNHYWFPVVAQWNFFFTPVVGAFAELGFAIQHANDQVECAPGVTVCALSDTYTRLRPVFLVGPRFILAKSFAITVRVGIPYLTIGGSFLL